jgi:DNA modification methylase
MKPTIIVGDNRRSLACIATGSAQMLATSPPYFGLRLYGDAGEEIGKERDLDAYVSSLVEVMRECRRVLRDDGTAWVNLGDSYGKDGSALCVPHEVQKALRADGWILRAMLPWVKVGSAMPESVQSRPCIAHEYVLFLTKRASGYFYDADAVRLPHLPKSEQRYKTGLKLSDAVRDTRGHYAHGLTKERLGDAMNPAGRSLRSSDFWRAGAREAGAALLAAAEGEAVGMLTNEDAPAAFCVNPKGSGIPHFAMWPTRLVAPMILAGTPEAGCCSVCGAPWMRIVERVGGPPRGDHRKKNGMRANPQGSVSAGSVYGGDLSQLYAKHGYPERHTTGFRPSCDHAAPTVPATVFDPFVGAGTTLAVAECLGRNGTGCELYQKNADLYPQRLDIVRAEIVEYLRERAEGDKAAAVDASTKGQALLF